MRNTPHSHRLLASIAALGMVGAYAPNAFAVAYSLNPSLTTTAQDWNTSATWTSTGGTTPGAAVGDTATISGDYQGVAQTVNISATLTNPLTGTLTIGDNNTTPSATTISSSGGSLALSGVTINSSGTAGAVNTISAPILLTGNLTIASPSSPTPATNGLTITGKITPSVGASRTIENSSVQTVNLGDIDISTGSTTGVILTIRSGTTTASTAGSHLNLNGTIANGGDVAAALTLGARSGTALVPTNIQVNGTNTYTGNTILGIQSNVFTTFKINSDQPFGAANTGSLTIGAASGSTAIFEAVGSDRTISKNSTTMNRNIAFQGSNSLTFASTTLTTSNNFAFTNNITAVGKTVTLGSSGGTMYFNNNNTDLLRTREFAGAGTTILASDIVENSGSAPTTASRMGIKNSGIGTLVIAGDAKHQGGIRLTNTGTVQIGNGSTSGAYSSANSVIPVVSGTAAGNLAFNRSDSTSNALVATGPINMTQKGAGAVTLTNTQFNWGNTTIGDGTTASKLVVNGGLVAQSATTTNAAVVSTTTFRTVTLAGADTVANLGITVGQPVWVTGGSASAASYVDSITGANTFTVWGETLIPAVSSSLTFGAGSALGTSAATTTINNLGTLAGTGVIAGSVNALTGATIAPGATDGAAGTLTTGALSFSNGANLKFDLAATAAGTSDSISVGSNSLNFGTVNFDFSALTLGTLEVGAAYNLISGTGLFTGDANLINTTLSADLAGLYTPSYALTSQLGTNYLTVSFSAVPEPSSVALLAGMAVLGGCLTRRRRHVQA